CRAIPEHQLEAELFGIGHPDSIPPLLAKAHQGTLLLNDILALPKRQQLNLLHFFQQGTLPASIGAKAVDVRILATHTTDIEKALIDG
ncbi:sigma 54-interacting transcriptional regulator, partial [Bacillus cereus group sp. BC327]